MGPKKKQQKKQYFESDSENEDKFALEKASASGAGVESDDQDTLPQPTKPNKKKNQKKSPASSFNVLMSADDQNEEDDDEDLKPIAKAKSSSGNEAKKKEKPSHKEDDDEEDADLNNVMEELSLDSSKKKKSKSKGKESTITTAPSKKSSSSSAAKYRDADEDSDDDEGGNERAPAGSFSKKTDNLAATGILLSHERSKDIQVDKFSLSAFGQPLVQDTSLSLLYGKRYGLVGRNGCGKSTLLKCIANREIPIQESMSLYLLEKEYDATDKTAVEAVIDIVIMEREKLEEELDELLSTVEGAESARCDFIQERLRELDLKSAESKAREVLAGLGFTREMQDMRTREFSGGWRMRVALARALFVRPTCLLLDDATNHLDLSAVVWLEEFLQSYPHTIVLVSHSQDFLNTVCTDILYLSHCKLTSYSGNYDTFARVKAETDENMRKRAKADEKKMKKIKENLGRTGAQAKQAKSAAKAMEKRKEKEEEKGLAPIDLRADRPVNFHFKECGGGLPSPFIKLNDVSFAYPERELLYKKLNMGLDLKSRIALVGPNGGGKSTLMKLLVGALKPTSGTSFKHHHLRIGRFHQHLTEQLDLSMSAIEWLCREFDDIKPQEMRSIVGNFGLTGKSQTIPMEQLSDGQKRRVVFCWLAQKNCHLLMLDEPTNFLDPESIDALAEAINEFDGGVVLISHDFRLINQVAEQIWVVEHGLVEEWEGDIAEYKKYLKQKVTSGGQIKI